MDDNRQALIRNLTLVLLYLTSWEEDDSGGLGLRSSKNHDRDAIDSLLEDGFINANRNSKSVYITDKGRDVAEFFAPLYGMAYESAIDALQNMIEEQEKHPGAFMFRLDLDLGEDRTCYRDIVVPAWFDFELLHQAIQSAFLWQDYHLYDFRFRSHRKNLVVTNLQRFSTDSMFDPYYDEGNVFDTHGFLLDSVFPRTRKAVYSYDYGDDWKLSIEFIEKLDTEINIPTCVNGEGDAPPDDVGGISGFEMFLDAIDDENDPEHGEMVEWGESQGFMRFDLDSVNARMRDWFDEIGLVL